MRVKGILSVLGCGKVEVRSTSGRGSGKLEVEVVLRNGRGAQTCRFGCWSHERCKTREWQLSVISAQP